MRRFLKNSSSNHAELDSESIKTRSRIKSGMTQFWNMIVLFVTIMLLTMPFTAHAGQSFYLIFYNTTDYPIEIRYDGGTCWDRKNLPDHLSIPAKTHKGIYHTEDNDKGFKCGFGDMFQRSLKLKYTAKGKTKTCKFYPGDKYLATEGCFFDARGENFAITSKRNHEERDGTTDIMFSTYTPQSCAGHTLCCATCPNDKPSVLGCFRNCNKDKPEGCPDCHT